MIDKKVNAEEQVQRMKNLMNYGLNENKKTSSYSGVEYYKEAADGKLYGIVREGAKFYIKVAKDPKAALIAENYDYIGGFRNRKDNMFESFASAQRYFCEKLSCINESIDDAQKRVIAESWDLDEKKEVIEEGTKKMKAEIARQRQIMMNAQRINEGKKQCCDMEDCPKCETMKVEGFESKPGAPFTITLTNKDVKDAQKANIKDDKEPMVGNKKATNESTEVPLSSRKDPDYMDTSHGTKIGDNTPFVDKVEDKDENAVAEKEGGEAVESSSVDSVNEEVALYNSENQNNPTPGVGEVGDANPFEEKVDITEDVDDLDNTLEDEDDDDVELGVDVDADDETEEPEVEDDTDVVDVDDDTEEPVDDTEARLDAMEDKLNQILDAINNMKYDDDDDLYDDEDEEEAVDDEEEEGPIEDEYDEDEYEVVESKSYKEYKKKFLKEEDDFGKHPAYQKKVMTTPPINMPEKEGQYDMNDKSAEGDKPYGIKKGSAAPFEYDAEEIENAITESIVKVLKKKLA